MFREYYRQYSDEFIQTLQSLDFAAVERIKDELEVARSRGSKVYIIGNGGSAASASHWACDFGKGVNVDGIVRFRVQSLADALPWITALGNDISYDDIFKEQLENELMTDDLVIGLSVSGNSENLIRAFRLAREVGAKTAALIGDGNGKMGELADLVVRIPSRDYGIVEDVHMFINHVISQHLKQTYLKQREN